MQISTDAIVLKEHLVDQESRVVSLLTRNRGVIHAYIRGAKRLRRTVVSSTQLFCYSHFVLFKNKNRYSVDSADINTLFFEITQDIETFTLAAYLSQLMLELAPVEEDTESYLRLMLNSLHLLKEKKRTVHFIKPVFELRLLSMAGYMPDLVACDCCAAYEGETMYFQPLSGTLRCGKCSQNTSQKGLLLSGGVLAAMRHILYAPMSRLFSFSVSEENLKNLGIITEYYLLTQLGKDFPSLEMYRSLFRQPIGLEIPKPDDHEEKNNVSI